jgi:serine/threonine-protein kinase HipA
MFRNGKVFYKNIFCGVISEHSEGYGFQYDPAYLTNPNAQAISGALPLRSSAFNSTFLFPFFDGLIPEGWLLNLAEEHWKFSQRDRMGLLLHCCKDSIGAVSIIKNEEL